MITATRTLDQVRPLTNAERLALYRAATERAEVSNEYRQRYEHGVRYKRALNAGHPGRVTGIYGELEDAQLVCIVRTIDGKTEDMPSDNVVSIRGETA